MKKYIIGLVCLVLLSSCKKDKLPDNGGGSDVVGQPTLITNPNTNMTRYSTKLSGSIIDTGYSEIIEAGFVIDTTPSPTVLNNLRKFIRDPDQNGLMVIVIQNFSANTTYYFRCYATNEQGTGYGNEIQFTTLSQNIFNGDVTLTTQQEVEEFGQAKYTTIDGTLEISGSVTDLSPLKNLAIINYAFNLRYTSQLTTIKGMDSLEVVNASYFFHGIRIDNNKSLRSLEGLEKLTGNNGYLYIINNDELTDLNGLNNLSYNHFGELRIEGCDKLINLHGLEEFQWLDGDIMIKDNPVLEDISAFGNLNFITGRIRIKNNTSLQSGDGFKSLHKAEGIEVYGNTMLSNLKVFSSLDTVTLGITLINNSALTDLSGLEKLKTCQGFDIEYCPSLRSLKGLENLANAGGGISIKNNQMLNDFCPLKPLLQTGWNGELVIIGNEVNPTATEIINSCP